MLRRKHAASTEPVLVHVGSFLVEVQTPSQNQVQGWLRKSPGRYTKLKNTLFQWVMVASANAKIPKATGKRHLTFTRSFKSERYRLDDDNLIGGCKSLRDACTHYGIILDDDESSATFGYDQVKQTTGSDWVEVGVFDYV